MWWGYQKREKRGKRRLTENRIYMKTDVKEKEENEEKVWQEEKH